MDDKRIMQIIRAIIERGNHAEVRKAKDGTLKVYEVKMKIADR